jgi:hypothetical protein
VILMEYPEVKIQVYDKREKITSTLYVEQLSGNKFRMTDNDLVNCRLTKGTEFETRINKHGDHEIIRIIKDSEFITKRFLLSSQFKESDYRMLGDELEKRGGFWQVDFGSIATVNIPQNLIDDFEKAMKDLNIDLSEITE